MKNRFLCALSFYHRVTITEFEHGPNHLFRSVDRCECGNKKRIGPWVDDNALLGHGQ